MNWDSINRNYQKYINLFPEHSVLGTPEDIDYPLQSAVQGDDTFSYIGNINSDLEREFLLEYNPELTNISELDIEVLCKLPIGLMDVLKVQISEDHMEYWRFTCEVLSTAESEKFDDEIVNQLELLVALTLSPIPDKPTHQTEKWSNEWTNATVIEKKNILASYLAYPLLEGVLKMICCRDIHLDGTVKKGRIVQTLSGEVGHSDDNNRVSGVGDLLYHLEKRLAEDNLSTLMEGIREKIADFYDWEPDEVYGVDGLSGLRNQWLHGTEQASAEFGTLLNLISLLVWAELTGMTKY